MAKYEHRIVVLCSKVMKDKVVLRAHQHGENMSAYVRRVLCNYVQEESLKRFVVVED